MLTELLDSLEGLIGPSRSIPPGIDWGAIQRGTGLTFPADYKALVARYRSLEFNQYLSIRHPGYITGISEREAAIAGLDSIRRLPGSRPWVDAIDADGKGREIPVPPFYPEEGGIYPWGYTIDGQVFAWLTGPSPENWTVVVAEYSRYWFFEGSMLEFLIGFLSGEISCPFLGPPWKTEPLRMAEWPPVLES